MSTNCPNIVNKWWLAPTWYAALTTMQ